jgi:hypothetical protein
MVTGANSYDKVTMHLDSVHLKERRMVMDISKLATILALVVISFVGVSRAQEPKKTTHQKVRTITGCLQTGDDANEFKLTGQDGGKWDVKSDNVKLAPHSGHTVTVTAVVSNASAHGAKEDIKDEAKEHGVAKNSTETGDLTVTTLKMVSKSCKE